MSNENTILKEKNTALVKENKRLKHITTTSKKSINILHKHWY